MQGPQLPFPYSWKFLLCVSALWVLILVVLYGEIAENEDEHTRALAYAQSTTLFNAFKNARAWVASLNGVLTVETAQTPRNLHLPQHEQVVRTEDGTVLARVNPAYMIRQLAGIVKQDNIGLRLPGLKPMHPQNEPDDWERAHLIAFESDEKEAFALQDDQHTPPLFRFMAPLRATPACLHCHPTRKEGDILGGLSVSFSARPLLDAAADSKTHYALMLTLLGLTSLCGFIFTMRRGADKYYRLIQDEERYRIVSGLSNALIFDYNVTNDKIYLSQKWKQFIGNDGAGRSVSFEDLRELMHPDDEATLAKLLDALKVGRKNTDDAEVRIRTSDGSYLWCLVRGCNLSDQQGKVLRIIGSVNDVDAEKKEKERLEEKAARDSLTGIYNKGAIRSIIDEYLAQHAGEGTCALLMVDVDNFKTVNDSHGHLFGDHVSQQVAHLLSSSFGEHAVAGRVGGDEFTVFITTGAERQSLEQQLGEFFQRVHTCVTHQGACFPVGCSVGVAMSAARGESPLSLLEKADAALYAAKAAGKDGFTFYEEPPSAQA